jgi:GntR family transcriptional regulator
MSELDFSSPVPLYHQLAEILERDIRSGKYAVGEQLPTAKELAEKYRVGLQTVRAALTQLENKGLITRHAGKGTFVAERRSEFFLDRSFTRQMRELGRTPSSRVLTSEVRPADQALAAELGLTPGAPVFHLYRVRYGDGDPVSLQYTLVPTHHCPDITSHDFSRESLYEVLSHCYNIEISEIIHTISCAAATPEQASLLGVRVRTPLLIIRTRAIANDGTLVEQTLSYYRADKYEYRTTYAAKGTS